MLHTLLPGAPLCAHGTQKKVHKPRDIFQPDFTDGALRFGVPRETIKRSMLMKLAGTWVYEPFFTSGIADRSLLNASKNTSPWSVSPRRNEPVPNAFSSRHTVFRREALFRSGTGPPSFLNEQTRFNKDIN